jgi:hypothetical protein
LFLAQSSSAPHAWGILLEFIEFVELVEFIWFGPTHMGKMQETRPDPVPSEINWTEEED